MLNDDDDKTVIRRKRERKTKLSRAFSLSLSFFLPEGRAYAETVTHI